MAISGKFSLTNNLNFMRGFQTKAMKTGNVTSQEDRNRYQKQKMQLSPQNIGENARRISVEDNRSKTPQQRFFDFYG